MMTRIFDQAGKFLPVTIIEVKQNTVTQVKNQKNDGYDAVQFGALEKRHHNKAEVGHLAKSKTKSKKLYEAKLTSEMKVGDQISLEIFQEGEKVNTTAISKGKGFAGTVKRHNFNTGPKTHGSNNYRQPGSIGDTGPQRVAKGKKMAGHMGHSRVTTKNLTVVKLDKENNRIFLLGAVPGPNKQGVLIWSPNELIKEEPNVES